LGAVLFGAHLADPDGFLGPLYLRLPLVVVIGFGIDLVPRTVWVSRGNPARMAGVFRERLASHWTRERVTLVVTGALGFYLTYFSYRNLKSELPFIEGPHHVFDPALFSLDRALFLGHVPAVVLHSALGTGVAAEFLSLVYVWFMPLTPFALVVWLVWSRNIGYGYWFATSQCAAWAMGIVSYYALPSLGPGFEHPWLFTAVDNTTAERLLTSLADSRVWAVDTTAPTLTGATSTFSGVAAFASLHMAITLLVALMVQFTTRMRWLKIVVWVNATLTSVAVIYLGYHYLADLLAGAAIALVAFYTGGLASDQSFARRPVQGHGTPDRQSRHPPLAVDDDSHGRFVSVPDAPLTNTRAVRASRGRAHLGEK
ncbi:MAG: phosphatase PAP2 family protein, partial [Nocardioides sp.]